MMREGIPLKRNNMIHITFHNPNTAEDTAKYLTRLLAQSMAENVIRKGAAKVGRAKPASAANTANATI